MLAKIKLNLSAIILGIASMMAQIVIIRELIIIFYGNELSLSVILGIWLFWVSIGSLILGRFVDILKFKERLLSWVQLATSIILPLNIIFIRTIKPTLDISPGQIIGFAPMFTISFVSLSVICIIFGFTFTLISKMASKQNDQDSSKAVGRVYLLEGLGASIGGLLYSFFLVKSLSPFQNALLAGSLCLCSSLFFNRNIIQLIYLISILVSFMVNWSLYLDRFTRKIQFSPFSLVESIDSIYGNITVVKTDSQFSFYENGLLVFTERDFLTSEESVHYTMLEHPAPGKVLLIGGGIGGSLKEILKHPVKSVDYVELDPMIIELGERYLPSIKDKRVNIFHIDGRAYVKQALINKTPPYNNGYDVIILNLPDPYTAMLNRFYSLEFYKEIKGLLLPDGIFSFSLSASENYINPENAMYLSCIYHTLKMVFQDIKTLPGENILFLASDKLGLTTYNSDILIKRLKERQIRTKFVREYYIPFKMNPLRIKYIQSIIKATPTTKLNTDFRPIGYLYHIVLWLTQFNIGINILPYLKFINIYSVLGLICIVFLLIYFIQKITHAPFRRGVALSIFTTGMSEMAFQIITILAFQFLYGYLYYKIGLLLSAFMVGLVLGSLCIYKIFNRIKDERYLYIITQRLICIYPLVLPIVFILTSKVSIAMPDIAKGLEKGFVFLPIIAGFIGGFQFPLATKICLKNYEQTGAITGFLYGLDLAGSCIGGLIVGLILIPLVGIIETTLILSIINIAILGLLHISRFR